MWGTFSWHGRCRAVPLSVEHVPKEIVALVPARAVVEGVRLHSVTRTSDVYGVLPRARPWARLSGCSLPSRTRRVCWKGRSPGTADSLRRPGQHQSPLVAGSQPEVGPCPRNKQIVSISSFVSRTVSAVTKPCSCRTRDTSRVNDCVPIKLYLQQQAVGL